MSAQERSYRVGVSVTVVPDGFTPDGRCRISLQVMPEPKTLSPGERAVDIRHWPLEIAKLAKAIRIAGARLDVTPDPQPLGVTPTRYLRNPVSSDLSNDLAPETDPLVAAAQKLWTTIFTTGEMDGFGRLIDALPRRPGTGTNPPPVSTPAVPREVVDYAGPAMGSFIRSISASATAATLNARLTRLAAAEHGIAVADLPDVLVRDANRPDVMWWRGFHDRWMSPPLPDASRLTTTAASGAESLAARTRTIEAAATFIREQATAPAFWSTAEAPSRVADPALTVRREVSRMLRSWGFGEKHVETASESDQLRERAPLRKFGGILSYPTLAKYFGLIVDVLVAPDDIKALLPFVSASRHYGALAADFGDRDATGDKASVFWSAAVLGPSVSGPGDYFGPCDVAEARRQGPDKTDFFRDGILNLNVELNGRPRFVVSQIDELQTTLSFERAAAEIVSADRAGQLPAEQSTRLPPTRPAGIKLTDLSITANQKVEPRLGLVAYATHLMAAYRFDVAMTPCDSLAWDESRWRTLVGRRIGYSESDVPAAYLKAVEPVRHRDDGRVQHAAGSGRFETPDGTVIDRTSVNQDLLVWKGEGLGAPSFHQERQIHDCIPITRDICVDARFDLGVNLTFDLPQAVGKDTRKCAPPLRERRSYIIGARACFTNGCGVDFPTAAAQYAKFADPVVLGKSAGKPLCFKRLDEIQAPDVLLPSNDRLVTARDPATEAPGETIDTLVVRSGAFATRTAQRLLMPARASFDASEVAGVFDKEPSHVEGAFAGDVRFRSWGEDGAFPFARDGEIFPKPNATPDVATDSTKSRGTVLVLDSQADIPGRGFHPDPLGGAVCARFCEPGTHDQAPDFDSHAQPFRFWPPKGAPSAAKPIALEVSRSDDPTRKENGWFGKSCRTQALQVNGTPLDVDCIPIVLQKAADVELELWPHVEVSLDCDDHEVLADALSVLREIPHQPRPVVASTGPAAAVASTHAARLDRLLAVTASGQIDAQAAQELDGLLCLGSIPTFCTQRRVRLVHAVDRPLTHPEFARTERKAPTDPAPRRRFAAVVVTVASEAEAADRPAGLRTWREFAHAHRALEPFVWPSQANGSTTFFVGTVKLDRASTATLRCDAHWLEYETAGIHRDAQGKWRFDPRPVPRTTLFTVDQIAKNDAESPAALDLLKHDAFRVETPEYRGLAYAFPDGKARRLNVELIATSRFTPFFPPAPPPRHAGDLGPYEEKSTEVVDDVWVPATFRPSPPEIDRIMPLFRWSFNEDAADIDPAFATKLTWKRRAGLRLYLKRESCYSSGEGEKLAVAFGPFIKADNSPLDLCGFEDAVGDFGGFITRWGADPIHESGRLDDLMPFDHLVGGEEHRGLRLPYAVEAVVGEERSHCTDPLKAGDTFSVTGDRFIRGATATVNGEKARRVEVLNSMEAIVELDKEAPCPPDVRLHNPDLLVSVKAFKPEIDPEEGLWFCDLEIKETRSYYPFVQFGLANYQKHAAPDLNLSRPRTAWAQLPPTREGSVTFHPDRKIVVTHQGVGYRRSASTSANARLLDAPRLNLRLLRASSPGRVPHERDGSPAWTFVLDAAGQPMKNHLCLTPIPKGDEVWWCEEITLPPCRPGTRYGLMIEEYEFLEADPDPVIHPGKYRHDEGKLTVETSIEERSPLFLHIVDLGE
ncbi:MAG TPA: hypothetical protein VFT47_14010 [Vicinamibacterales bacterium]|nr:hypothetical protein [Vicinamibacterales bacterium]